jgi:hypothetical protein
VKELTALYRRWAARCGVVPPDQLPPVRKIIPAVDAAGIPVQDYAD